MSTEPSTPLTVTLSSWHWHRLLRQLEEDMRVCNVDQEVTYQLYELIASQLAGHPVRVQRPEPKTVLKPVKSEKPTASVSLSRWKRFLTRWGGIPADE